MMSPYIVPGLTRFKTMDEVADIFCKTSGIPLAELQKPNRKTHIRQHRQALTYYLRRMTTASLTQIGQFLGGQDHSTVIYSIEVVMKDMQYKEGYKAWLESLNPANTANDTIKSGYDAQG